MSILIKIVAVIAALGILVLAVLAYPVYRDTLLKATVYNEHSLTFQDVGRPHPDNTLSVIKRVDPPIASGTSRRTTAQLLGFETLYDQPLQLEYTGTGIPHGYYIGTLNLNFVIITSQLNRLATYRVTWLSIKPDAPLGTAGPLALNILYGVVWGIVLLMVLLGMWRFAKATARSERSYYR